MSLKKKGTKTPRKQRGGSKNESPSKHVDSHGRTWTLEKTTRSRKVASEEKTKLRWSASRVAKVVKIGEKQYEVWSRSKIPSEMSNSEKKRYEWSQEMGIPYEDRSKSDWERWRNKSVDFAKRDTLSDITDFKNGKMSFDNLKSNMRDYDYIMSWHPDGFKRANRWIKYQEQLGVTQKQAATNAEKELHDITRKLTPSEAWEEVKRWAGVKSDGYLTNEEEIAVTKNMEWIVVDKNYQTFNEKYIGAGYLWSTSDYGRSRGLSESELITKVKKDLVEGGTQYIKLYDKKAEKVADTIIIVKSPYGYAVAARNLKGAKK